MGNVNYFPCGWSPGSEGPWPGEDGRVRATIVWEELRVLGFAEGEDSELLKDVLPVICIYKVLLCMRN